MRFTLKWIFLTNRQGRIFFAFTHLSKSEVFSPSAFSIVSGRQWGSLFGAPGNPREPRGRRCETWCPKTEGLGAQQRGHGPQNRRFRGPGGGRPQPGGVHNALAGCTMTWGRRGGSAGECRGAAGERPGSVVLHRRRARLLNFSTFFQRNNSILSTFLGFKIELFCGFFVCVFFSTLPLHTPHSTVG